MDSYKEIIYDLNYDASTSFTSFPVLDLQNVCCTECTVRFLTLLLQFFHIPNRINIPVFVNPIIKILLAVLMNSTAVLPIPGNLYF